MRRFFKPSIYFVWFFVSFQGLQWSQAASYLVTAQPSQVYCGQNRKMILRSGEVLRYIRDGRNEDTFIAELPQRFSKTCPLAVVDAYDVFKIRDFEEFKLTPKASPKPSPKPSVKPDPKQTNPSSALPSTAQPQSSQTSSPPAGSESGGVYQQAPAAPRTEALPENTNKSTRYTPFSDKFVLGSSESANLHFRKILKSYSKIDSKKKLPPDCVNKFLGKDGYGPYGAHLKTMMATAPFEKAIRNGDRALVRYCKSYPKMTLEQRKNLLVLVMLMQVNWESSCKNRNPNPGAPNGTANGLTQLDWGRENTYFDRRHKGFKKYCPRNVSQYAKPTLTCTLAMLVQDINQGEPIVANEHSYWAVFLPDDRRYMTGFKKAFAMVPDCQMSEETVQLAQSFPPKISQPAPSRKSESDVVVEKTPPRSSKQTMASSEDYDGYSEGGDMTEATESINDSDSNDDWMDRWASGTL